MALSIFAVVSTMAYGGLRTVMEAATATRDQAARLAALQLTFGLLAKDLEQAAPRPIRDAYGDVRAAMDGSGTSEFALELTRSGGFNPTGLTRSALRRVAYGVREGTLLRYSWAVLDRGDDRTGLARELVDGVEGFSVRFLHPAQGWRDSWPPASDEQSTVGVLPRAVELRVVVQGTGEIRRIIRVAG
jgi:general secretion pathway protein J